MRSIVLLAAFLLGLAVAACTDPEEEDLGSFPCGDEECDVRTEYCSVDDDCGGSGAAPPTCVSAPDECNGTVTVRCVGGGGLGCSEGDGGGISCSPSCG